MLSPLEVIEQIRRDEYLIGVEMDPAIARATGGLKRRLGNSLKLLSEDLYSSDAHFILELIQNADDNTYPEGVAPQVGFDIKPNRLEVRNNESGFSEEHVRALCSVGESTKSKQKRLGFIGEKGIGFKSVFTVSDAPEIHSNGFHFRFDRRDGSDPLGYVVPHWIGDGTSPAASSGTIIVLPAKEMHSFNHNLLKGIEGELLLFMRRLRALELSVDGKAGKTRFARRDAGDILVLREQDGESPDSRRKRYLVTRRLIDVKDHREEMRFGVELTEIVLAFPIDKERAADATHAQRVFAFLPIRDYGFRFVVQGDFLLSTNREDVHRDADWNTTIRDQIGPAFVDSVNLFKQHAALSHTFYGFIPLADQVTDTFFAPVVEQIHQGLAQVPCLLTRTGSWATPSGVLRADADARRLIPNRELQRMLSMEYLSAKVVAEAAVLDAIGCQRFGMEHLLKCLEDSEWVQRHKADWFGNLYRYLARRPIGGTQLESLKTLKIVRLASGELASITEGTVFLPIDRTKHYGFEHEMRVLEAECLDVGAEDRPKMLKFLTGLGVREMQPAEVIDRHILPVHKSDAWRQSKPKARIGHVAYVKDHLDAYLAEKTKGEQSWTRDKAERAIRKDLADQLWIQTHRQRDGANLHSHLALMYVGKDYGNGLGVEALLDVVESVYFVSPIYIKATRAAGNAARIQQEWAGFFERLGAHCAPRVDATQGNGWGTLTPDRWPQTSAKNGYEHSDCVPSAELKALMASPQLSIRKAIVELFDVAWGSYYSAKCDAAITGTHYGSRNSVTCDSSFRKAVTIMGVGTKAGKTCPLGQTYLDTPAMRAVFGNDVPYLDAVVRDPRIFARLGVVIEVDETAALRRLAELRKEANVELKTVQTLYRVIESRCSSRPEFVRERFSKEPLIYVPAKPGRWLRSSEVCWKSYGAALSNVVPALSEHYREFESFLLNMTGIVVELGPVGLINALNLVSQASFTTQEYRNAARRVYQELEVQLRREAIAAGAGSVPDWAKAIGEAGLWWTNHEAFWKNEGDVFVNDLPDVGALFAGRETIAYLDLEPASVPRYSRLLETCGIPRISHAIQREFVGGVTTDPHDELTSRLQDRWLDIARHLHAEANTLYDALTSAGQIAGIHGLKVFCIPSLQMTVRLNDEVETAKFKCLVTSGGVFLDAQRGKDTNSIAIELCKFLAVPVQLASFLSQLLAAADRAEIDRLFQDFNIPNLPEEEIERQQQEFRKLQTRENEPNVQAATSEAAGPRDHVPQSETDAIIRADADGDAPEEPQIGANVAETNGDPLRGGARTSPPTDGSEADPDDLGDAPPADEPAANGEAEDPTLSEQESSGATPPSNDTSDKPSARSGDRASTGHAGTPPSQPTSSKQSPSGDASQDRPTNEPELPKSDGAGHKNHTDSGHSGGGGSGHTTSRSTGESGRPSGKAKRRVPVYVPTDEDDDTTDNPANAERRQETARLRRELGAAAVQIVQQDPEWVGWTVNKPESETNEGFDLQAIRGDEVRYIEVKGVVDVWDDVGVAVTAAQFWRAARERKKFWLYVVEHVNDGLPPVIHRIHDPITQITEFRFIGSWQKLDVRHTSNTGIPPVPVGAKIHVDGVGAGSVLATVVHQQLWKVRIQFADGPPRDMPWNASQMKILSQAPEGGADCSNDA